MRDLNRIEKNSSFFKFTSKYEHNFNFAEKTLKSYRKKF